MELSTKGALELIGYEAIVQTRYLDPSVWTIGVGHTKAAGLPDPERFRGTLSIPDVYSLFRLDVAKYVAEVNAALKRVGKEVNQAQFDALVSFHYNTGKINT